MKKIIHYRPNAYFGVFNYEYSVSLRRKYQIKFAPTIISMKSKSPRLICKL